MLPYAIMAIQNSNRRNFMTGLYIDYHALLRHKAFAILGSYQDAEDTVSAAFARLVGKVEFLEKMESCVLTAYVVSTVENVARNFIKHRGVVSKHAYLGSSDDALDAISKTDGGEDIQRLIADRDAVSTALGHLGGLPEMDMRVLEYKYILQLSDKEIAALLDIKPQSVRQYLTRARRKAKELLKERGITSSADI